MSDFVEQCRREWKRLGVPDPLAEEMAADLASDLGEAEAEGVSAEELLGTSAHDPRSFAASWAAERGVIPAAPDGPRGRRRPRVLVAFTAHAGRCGAAAPDRRAQDLARHDQIRLAHSPGAGVVRAPDGPAPGPPHQQRLRAGRVDPAVPRDRRARLRGLAVGELEPLASTRRYRVARYREGTSSAERTVDTIEAPHRPAHMEVFG